MESTTTPDTLPAVAFIGIDVAKVKLDACLLLEGGKAHHKRFANTPAGFTQLLSWAKQSAPEALCHLALEASACYSDGLATFLADANERVSLLNPARVRYAALAAGTGNKTDKADAKVIADASAAPWPQGKSTPVDPAFAAVEKAR